MLALCVKGFITFCLLAVVFYFVDFAGLVSILRQSDLKYIILAFCVQFVLSVPQALRWRLILNHAGVSVRRLPAWYNVLLGLLFNQALPSSVGGDAVRIYEARKLGVNIVFQSILFDRISALVILSGMCLFILLFFALPLAKSPSFFLMLAVVCLTLVGAIILAYLGAAARYFCLADRPVVMKIINVSDNFRKLSSSGPTCLAVISLSLLIHTFISVSGVLIFVGLGVNFSFVEIGAIFALVNLFSVIPVSIGGWGLREGLSIFLFSIANINYEQALAASLIFGVVMLMVGLVGGAIWMIFGRKSEW